MYSFDYKLPGQRKARNWTVMAHSLLVIVQSDNCIGQLDRKGRGVLYRAGQYFHHLAMAESYTFPKDFTDLAWASRIQVGDLMSDNPDAPIVIFGGIGTIGEVNPTERENGPSPLSETFASFIRNWLRWAGGTYKDQILSGVMTKPKLLALLCEELPAEIVREHLPESWRKYAPEASNDPDVQPNP